MRPIQRGAHAACLSDGAGTIDSGERLAAAHRFQTAAAQGSVHAAPLRVLQTGSVPHP
jgi:hypothetical protein